MIISLGYSILYVKKKKYNILLFCSFTHHRYLAGLAKANVDKKVLFTHSLKTEGPCPNWNVGMVGNIA